MNAISTNQPPFANSSQPANHSNHNPSHLIAMGNSVLGYGLLTLLFTLVFVLLSLLPDTVLASIYGIHLNGLEVLSGSLALGFVTALLLARGFVSEQA